MQTAVRQKRKASINQHECVACGSCVRVCPRQAIAVISGVFAAVQADLCVGCGRCAKECPASVIHIHEVTA